MAEDTYSIKEMITEFRADVTREFAEVKGKQDHTNGTVRDHTIKLAMMQGALIIISVIVIPLCVYVWNQSQKVQEKLQSLTHNPQTYEINKNQ